MGRSLPGDDDLSLLLVRQLGWQRGAPPAPLGPEHWAIVRGLLHSKWGSVVVVDHVVILEAGHRTIISTTENFFPLFFVRC